MLNRSPTGGCEKCYVAMMEPPKHYGGPTFSKMTFKLEFSRVDHT